MKSLVEFTKVIFFNEIVSKVMEAHNLSFDLAKEKVLGLSFTEYHKLVETVNLGEAITPPSGQTIGPTGPGTGTPTNTSQAANAPQQNANMKSIWPGKGAPVEVGMTVGTKGPNGMPVPGQISQVDMGAKGVKIKNPTTGQDEWTNMDDLEPFMANGQPGNTQPAAAGQDSSTVATAMEEAKQLARLRELSGIKENCSAGATGAGSIAIAPAALGGMKKRQATDEEVKKEYTPKEAPKTIVGDTKPNQASGELSSTLAANGKKTASRFNNGYKK
jgi:hypothetical protein